MSTKRGAKTTGLEWLGYSLVSFNGLKYADRQSPEKFIGSYITYKQNKKDYRAIRLVIQNRYLAEEIVRDLLGTVWPN